ncbi:hypothetical protein BCR33DRAFT_451329 [Rhizoclosmatium globosum]|uniref:TPR-like protein n=1 Tax=Rhizoclosmatium globosum TaxID=329046 RepID=A0A1Y2CWM1_9FUNG|nr:hypothetical protein BCR33DRAFT_451329 [Rhizoclosmatium globosum]|eukprot:ORY51276.1 hypothetical protein BCR33DRAFT_451329 [Rhizoclosmatium globosum]
MTEATTAVKKSKKSKADKAEKAEKPKAEKAEKSVKTKETKETKDTTKEETQATPTTEPSKQVPVSVSVESAKVEKKKKKEKKAVSIEEFVDAPEHPIVESVVVPVPVPAPVLPEPEPVPEPTPAKKEKKKKEKDTAEKAEKLPKKKKRVFIMEQGSDDEDSDESGEVIVVRKVVKKETHSKKGKRVNSDSESDSSDITSDSSYDSDDSDEDDDEKPVTRTPVVDSKPSIFSSFRARFGTAATGGATATTSIEPSPASPAGVPTTVPLPQTDSDSEDEYTDDTEDEVDPTSATSTTSKASFFGSFTSALSSIPMPAALTSILEPEQTPEVRAREKQRKAQEVAIQRQMANNAKFAALNAVTGAIVDTSAPEVITSLRPSAPRTAATTRVPGMPIAPAPDSEREFTTGLNHYNNSNYPLAIVHFERAIKIDDNAESLRMLIEIHGPARVPNAAKVAEYSARRKAVLATPQGMLNHGRHLARITGSLDGPGIVLVRSAADDGNVEAMFEFGMYLRGKGKGGEAMGWLHKAAEGGWVDAEEAVAEVNCVLLI